MLFEWGAVEADIKTKFTVHGLSGNEPKMAPTKQKLVGAHPGETKGGSWTSEKFYFFALQLSTQVLFELVRLAGLVTKFRSACHERTTPPV
jgi:hypothetical protein